MTSRYDQLSPQARFYLENWDDLDMAEMLASRDADGAARIDTLIARLEAEAARMLARSEAARVPEVRWADSGHATGLRTAAVLAVHHLRGEQARDAYIAATEGGRTTPDNPVASTDAADNSPRVKGRCPACGGENLFVGDGGYVTCARLECPEPDAASTLLEREGRGKGRPQFHCCGCDALTCCNHPGPCPPQPTPPVADETPAAIGRADRAYWDRRGEETGRG